MEDINILESKEYYDNFSIMHSYCYIVLDFLSYIMISFILKSKNNTISLLKYNLYIILIVDIIYRISFIKTYFLIASFSKELLLTLLSSCQFYLILSFLEDVCKKVDFYENLADFEKLYPFKKSTYFFFIIFSYENFSHGFTKTIFLIENLVILGGLFKIYGYLRNKVYEITFVLRNIKQKNECFFLLIEYQTVNPFIYLSFCYILNIIGIFIERPLYLYYLNTLMIIIKEIGKYLIFPLFGLIVYTLKKYLFNEENSYNFNSLGNKVEVI